MIKLMLANDIIASYYTGYCDATLLRKTYISSLIIQFFVLYSYMYRTGSSNCVCCGHFYLVSVNFGIKIIIIFILL